MTKKMLKIERYILLFGDTLHVKFIN